MAKAAAKKSSKMDIAIGIYQKHAGKENRRALCVAEFQSNKKLDMQASTAATYYNLCFKHEQAEQQVLTDENIASKRKTKHSAVKFARGTNTVSHFQCFLKKSDAEAYNENEGFSTVVKGVAKIGQTVAVK